MYERVCACVVFAVGCTCVVLSLKMHVTQFVDVADVHLLLVDLGLVEVLKDTKQKRYLCVADVAHQVNSSRTE